MTEYRQGEMQVLVQILRAEGVSVDLERVGIDDPIIDFFKQLLLSIWIILVNELNDLKQFRRPLATDLKENEYEPLEVEEPGISIQSELEKKPSPEPRTPTIPTGFANEKAEEEGFTTSARAEMDEKYSLKSRRSPSQFAQPFSQSSAAGPIHAAANNPNTETPNPGVSSSSGAEAGTYPLMPQAPSRAAISGTVAPSRSSNTPGGTQLGVTSAGQIETPAQPIPYHFDVFYLLLCIKNSRYLTQWTPLDVTYSRREQSLFEAMVQEYRKFKRRKAWFWATRYVSIKDVIAIKFIKVSRISISFSKLLCTMSNQDCFLE